MKVLFAAPVVDGRQMDMARVFRFIGEEMRRRGHVVHYFLEEEMPPLWIKSVALLEWGVRATPTLARKCRQNSYDVVVVASASGWMLSTYRKWLLPRKTRIVSWHHGYEACFWPQLLADEKNGNGKLSKRYKAYYNAVLWANRQSFLTQDGALFTSTEDRDWAQKQYPLHAPKALYQPNGVSPEYYFPERYDHSLRDLIDFP
ncbi:MAG TPA: glycosyltransferase, partial [Oculatellaceae cyanobacterium]